MYACIISRSSFSVFFLMIRRPPRSTLDRSSAASDVYKRQIQNPPFGVEWKKVAEAVKDEHNQRGFAGRFGAGPVSYTHLRAHETVLDLVCRLLLEKKNSNTNKSHVTT